MRPFFTVLVALLATLASVRVGDAQSLRQVERAPIVPSVDSVMPVDSSAAVASANDMHAAQRSLATELAAELHAQRLAWTQRILRDALKVVERRVGAVWTGPVPVVLQVPDDGTGFVCDPKSRRPSRCLGRMEGIRRGEQHAFVLLIASSALLDRRVWEHELTHALLTEHGLESASRSHDPRYFRQ